LPSGEDVRQSCGLRRRRSQIGFSSRALARAADWEKKAADLKPVFTLLRLPSIGIRGKEEPKSIPLHGKTREQPIRACSRSLSGGDGNQFFSVQGVTSAL
jgi:hypothetical protein